jgi:hypothetical protein
MKKPGLTFCFFLVLLFSQHTYTDKFIFKQELPRQLREISGIIKDKNQIWAIVDGPGSKVFRIDTTGHILQEITIENTPGTDIESIAYDGDYIYLGDTGNNNGHRKTLHIFKIKKSAIPSNDKFTVPSEVISFSYPEADAGKKSKNNNYDAESLISHGDSLFIFTKRRGDHKTELVALPKQPGSYTARSIALFDCSGLITDATVSRSGKEIFLLGYGDGHQQPFLWVLSNYRGTNFFSGSQKRIPLSTGRKDWQTEGICFENEHELLLSCEETRDEKASLYGINKEQLSSFSY